MNSLLFHFTVDKSTHKVFVNREFAAEHSLVWDAFTKKEILDQWWAPKPWQSQTKSMEFKEGGRRFYAMVSLEGQKHWSIQDYTSITPKTNFKFIDAFADENENINSSFPSSKWSLDFKEKDDLTLVSIVIQHQSLTDLEQLIQMGFKEGFTMTLNDLDNLLNSLKNK